MKKNFLLKVLSLVMILDTCVLVFAFSQTAHPTLSGDTIGISKNSIPQFAPNKVLTLVPNPDGGWVYGVNGDVSNNFTKIAQAYKNNCSNVKISGVLMLVGSTFINNPNSKIHVSLNALTPNIAYDQFLDQNQPGPGYSALDTASIYLKNVKVFSPQGSRQYTVVNFKDTASFTGNPVVVVDFSELVKNGDTIGFFSDALGSGKGRLLSLQFASGNWFQTDVLYFQSDGVTPLNNDIALFPVIANVTGVNNIQTFSDINASLFPNPMKNNATLSIDFKNNADNAYIEIVDSRGVVCKTIETGNIHAGKYNIQLNLSNFVSGNYFYLIRTGNLPLLVKQFTIL